jgi:transposase
MFYNNVGIDIGKEELDVFFNNKSYKFKNNKEGIEKIVKKCIGNKVILESSGGYEKKLLKELVMNNIVVSVVNPMYVRNFAKSSKDLAKTDKIDAKMLSEYGEKMDPNPYNPKEIYRFEIEELTNRRYQIVNNIVAEKNRLDKDPGKFAAKSIKEHIEFLEKEQIRIEGAISESLKGEALEEDKILQSEKGIGDQTSALLIGSLPELGRVDNRQIAKLVGLAPMAHDSGKMKGKRKIRGGRDRVRSALYMAAISAIKSNLKVRDFYRRLKAKNKLFFVAITAVMRKLLVILNSKMRLYYEGKEVY